MDFFLLITDLVITYFLPEPSSSESERRNCVQNCRDIFNLLQLENSTELELTADWDRAQSPGAFNLSEDVRSLTPSKSSPLPPISKLKQGKSSSRPQPRVSPAWTRVESCDISFLSDLEDDRPPAEADKWIRSSTPANTLPKLQRKINLG